MSEKTCPKCGRGQDYDTIMVERDDYLEEIDNLQYERRQLESDLARVTAERDVFKAFLNGAEPGLPWPQSAWPMTDDEYCKAVPDKALRTAISGYLMREGWKLAIDAVRDQFKNALAELAEQGD